jgi:hypothetical protein
MAAAIGSPASRAAGPGGSLSFAGLPGGAVVVIVGLAFLVVLHPQLNLLVDKRQVDFYS